MDGNGPAAPAQPAQPQKYMRYRSVRRSAAKDPSSSSPPPMPQASQTSQTTLTRLPSRYRRVTKSAVETPPLPSLPQGSGAAHHASGPVADTQPHFTADNLTDDDYVRVEPTGSRGINIGNGAPLNESQSRNSHERSEHISEIRGEQVRRSLEIAREEARLILEGEDDRVRALRRAETERRRKLREDRHENVERKVVNETRAPDGRCEAQQRGYRGGDPFHPVQQVAHVQDSKRDVTMPIGVGKSKSRTLIIGGQTLSDQDRGHKSASSSAVLPSKPAAVSHSRSIQTEGPQMATHSSVIPDYDAPKSAINAGSRRITVRCKDSSLTIPVTPSTTCRDVLNYAARNMGKPINAQTTVLVESFSQLGLDRPIRRYERIRDILSSWDSDERNDLVIKEEGSYTNLDLRESGTPRQQPVGGTVQMYYSQKPGKWDKRWIQLRNDGQVMISKNGTDSTNICHLSDFDLYDPTEAQIKTLKPPRRMCFALKSQQKPSVFLEGASYVHFFSSKDQAIVLPWYHAVHTWRSWYLFNLVGDRQPTPPSAGSSSSRPSTGRSKESLPTVPHSSKPLLQELSTDLSTQRIGRSGSETAGRPSQGDGTRPLIELTSKKAINGSNPTSPKHSKTNSAPPTAFTRGLLEGVVRPGTSDSFEGRGFTGTGLLARSASRRSGPQDGKPLIDLQPTSEFTDGSLLRKLEAVAGPQVQPGHKIDRHKEGREIKIPVGEGFD
ncbi:hypothetical protein LTR10_021883 [Elasticomyces elasticus]|uniref:PH domain-containing protein n=1 Tax=Exophiala sideris TaxID=1016849 RepID=A0ABR0JQE1_9EURO|nr:hypothetical protein LTR10_021883 [Elasticomyces elasticus]KAK5039806.1 hypothetical protein LTS07_000301 [Exophiala sideris]KAK5041358.1 hypothetical protein LTR13_002833 [Exophiala sideris]KAK5068185.1 hypothetical protein LTR69_000303 [Exophiala sideris]KAK5187486.1 hypothetical protein LTR44_000302 [Eurotiomycetes sp. CCFEE 6388]